MPTSINGNCNKRKKREKRRERGVVPEVAMPTSINGN